VFYFVYIIIFLISTECSKNIELGFIENNTELEVIENSRRLFVQDSNHYITQEDIMMRNKIFLDQIKRQYEEKRIEDIKKKCCGCCILKVDKFINCIWNCCNVIDKKYCEPISNFHERHEVCFQVFGILIIVAVTVCVFLIN
jgi:regulator of RNase E activity RraB